jgi:hypothetical protein
MSYGTHNYEKILALFPCLGIRFVPWWDEILNVLSAPNADVLK